MKSVVRLLFVAAACFAVGSAYLPYKHWTGKMVILKDGNVSLFQETRVGKRVVVAQLYYISNLVLDDVNFRLKISDGRGTTGWLDKADAVVLDDAAAYFTKRIKQNKNDAFAYFGRAAAWELLGKPDLAIQDYDTLEDLDPRPFMFDGRGNMWMAKKDYKKAMKDFNKAIYLDPKFAPAYHNRAWVWVVLDEKARALADYREAIVLDPRLVSALYMRGMLYCRLGEFDNALVDFNEAIRIDTNALHAFYGKARAQYGLKRYDDAVTTWQAALEMNNDYSWGLMGWAHFLATCPDENRRDSKKALAMATRAMSLERNPDATFHAMAAAVFADSGDFVEAVRRQELALQDPQFIDVAEETNRLELYRERKPFRQE